MKLIHKGMVALVIVTLELSLLPILLEVGGKSIGVVHQLFLAFLMGSVVSIGYCYFSDRLHGFFSIVKSRNVFLIILLAGLLNDVVSQIFLGYGTIGTNPSIAAVIFRSWVVIVAILTPFILRQRVSRMQIFATFVGFLGIYIIATGGSFIPVNTSQLPFVGLLFASALASVFPNLAMKKYNVDIPSAIALFNVSSFVLSLFILIGTHQSLIVPNMSASTLITILFIGIMTYGIGTTLYYYSLKIFGPLFMGNSILLVPFFTIFLSFVIIGTSIKSYYLIGAALLSVGVIMQRKYFSAPEVVKSRKFSLPLFDVSGAFVNNRNPVIYHYIKNDGKAFVIRIEHKKDLISASKIFSKYDCLAFTNRVPHPNVQPEEIRFIEDMMGAKNKDTLLIGIGNPITLERSFDELFYEVSKSEN